MNPIDWHRAATRAARTALLSAAVVALGFGLLVPALSVDDSESYAEPARSFASGRGLTLADGRPMDYRLPLYPIALGLGMRTFGDVPGLPGALNAIFHVLSVLVVRRVLPRSSRVDAICALALIWPPLLTSTGLILQESLLGLTLAVAFVAGWRLLETPDALHALSFGLACGVSALGKTTVVPACVVVVLLLLLKGPSRRAFGQALIVAAGLTLMILPWGMRNLQVLGRFQVANPNGGANLLGGTVSNVIPSWNDMPEVVEARARWEAGEREHHRSFDVYLYRIAIERIVADPVGYAHLSFGRVGRFMLPARHWHVAAGLSQVGTLSPAYVVGLLGQALLFGAAAVIAFSAARRRRVEPALAAPAFVFTHQAVYAATHVSPRYAATVGPILFAALAVAAVRPWRAQVEPQAPRSKPSVLI